MLAAAADAADTVERGAGGEDGSGGKAAAIEESSDVDGFSLVSLSTLRAEESIILILSVVRSSPVQSFRHLSEDRGPGPRLDRLREKRTGLGLPVRSSCSPVTVIGPDRSWTG